MTIALFNKYDIENSGQPLHFRFESDFIEDNIRCIPMIVRFKLDACGIKLKLAHWSRFTPAQRQQLNDLPCAGPEEIDAYRDLLKDLILGRTGQEADTIPVETSPAWADEDQILPDLLKQVQEIGSVLHPEQWRGLSILQRFALIKLCRPGHENKNFPIAMKEFGL